MAVYPSIFEAKEQIIDIGKRMYDKGFVAANDGNISCKVSDTEILTTPTGVSKGFMDPDMIIKMNIDGSYPDDGGKYRPSSEVKMHLRVYRENPDVAAVCHAHPPVATSFSIAGIGLDLPIMTEGILALGSVPVAKYATPGTEEVPDSIAPFCREYNAVLLANHGALTWGASLMEAFYRLESVEQCCTITMNVRNVIGRYNMLSCDQVKPLLETREKLGIKGGGIPACALCTTNDRDVLPASGPIRNCPYAGSETGQDGGELESRLDKIAQDVLSRLK